LVDSTQALSEKPPALTSKKPSFISASCLPALFLGTKCNKDSYRQKAFLFYIFSLEACHFNQFCIKPADGLCSMCEHGRRGRRAPEDYPLDDELM